jgi:hypothetical protein
MLPDPGHDYKSAMRIRPLLIAASHFRGFQDLTAWHAASYVSVTLHATSGHTAVPCGHRAVHRAHDFMRCALCHVFMRQLSQSHIHYAVFNGARCHSSQAAPASTIDASRHTRLHHAHAASCDRHALAQRAALQSGHRAFILRITWCNAPARPTRTYR